MTKTLSEELAPFRRLEQRVAERVVHTLTKIIGWLYKGVKALS